MDEETKVDEIPSIKLNISSNGKEGTINLSAFYGSYNYKTDVDIVDRVDYQFTCPECDEDLESDIECPECKAHMVELEIKEGGEITFCSRAGCKKHTIEFDELTQIHDYFDSHSGETSIVDVNNAEQKADQKELIKTGTFLRIYCPHCYKSLISRNKVIFRIINQNNEEGYLLLSPFLNVFVNKSTIFVPEGAIAKDIQCSQCRTSLIAENVKCEKCGAPAVGVSVAAMRKLIDFYFCSKRGCNWHSLGPDDLQHVVIEDSDKW